MTTTVVYDSGALMALSDHRNWAAFNKHSARLADGEVLVPAAVAAQVVRKPATQARLMRTLHGCELIPFTADHHVAVGELLASSGTADVVDAFVALLAVRADAAIVTGDPGDLGHLLNCLGARRPVIPA
jgi:PIN domain